LLVQGLKSDFFCLFLQVLFAALAAAYSMPFFLGIPNIGFGLGYGGYGGYGGYNNGYYNGGYGGGFGGFGGHHHHHHHHHG
jgi:hypothetical protein